MARRRGGTVRAVCSKEGCTETAFYEYDNMDERKRLADTVRRYRCVRHTHEDEVLSREHPRLEKTMTIGPLEGCRDALFFQEQRNGFISGPGFKGFAKDFPAGTVVRVVCEIVSIPVAEGQQGEAEK